MTKPKLLALAVKRAIRHGFEANYFLADAWFGNKPTLRMTEENSLTAIMRMKKDKTKYRHTTFNHGKVQQQLLTAVEAISESHTKAMGQNTQYTLSSKDDHR